MSPCVSLGALGMTMAYSYLQYFKIKRSQETILLLMHQFFNFESHIDGNVAKTYGLLDRNLGLGYNTNFAIDPRRTL